MKVESKELEHELPTGRRPSGRPGELNIIETPTSELTFIFWHASLLQALSSSHAFLLQDCVCVAWTSASDRVPAPLAVSIALLFVQPSVGSRNSPPLQSTVTLPQLRMLFQSTHEDRQGAEAPAELGAYGAHHGSLGQARGGTRAHQSEAVD